MRTWQDTFLPTARTHARSAAGASAPAVTAVPARDRRLARRRADWRRRRLVLILMSPWIIGFSVFFGYPLVHEDDPERAIRAALQIVDSLAQVPLPDGSPL